MSACLHPCPSCARHVRADEATCPFCAAALSPDLAACARHRATEQPLSRAALVFATAAAIATTACGKEPKDETNGARADASASAVAVPAYGPAPQLLEQHPEPASPDAGAPGERKR